MAGDFDFLHLKRRTVGSSNELSFDVLDAARSKLDGNQRGSRHQVSGNAPRATFPGAHTGATLASAPEVERRKRARRNRTLRMWIIGVLAAALIVGGAVFLGFRVYDQHVTFKGQFTLYVDRLISIDKSLVEIDSFMADPYAAFESDNASGVFDDVPQLKDQLEDLAADADDMAQNAQTENEQAAYGEVAVAATARVDLLEPAQKTYDAARKVYDQVAKANTVWSKVLAADQLARESASMANEANTEEAITASRDKTYAAREQFDAALDGLKSLETDNKGLDLSKQKAYVQKREDALQHAIETSNALLANNRDQAVAANDAYNKADQQAADLAAELPDSVGALVAGLYSETVAEYETAYRAARDRVSEVDSDVRTRFSR